MPIRVLEVQPTPNPNAVKFILDQAVSDAPTSFFNAPSAVGHPLAERLFEIPGVTSVLLLGDFVTVNKDAATKWDGVVSAVQAVLAAANGDADDEAGKQT